MRLCSSPGGGAGPGTGGDVSGQRSPASPQCPHSAGDETANEFKLSPVSPPVPGCVGDGDNYEDFAGEAFEERAAIMEYEGGMTRAAAEAAARELLRAST